jgi:hypothetical protein
MSKATHYSDYNFLLQLRLHLVKLRLCFAAGASILSLITQGDPAVAEISGSATARTTTP